MGRGLSGAFAATSAHRRCRVLTGFALAIALLSGCDGTGKFSFPTPGQQPAETAALRGNAVARDVESPEVFSAREDGLWDGRPSLGGVWVAHPDVDDPERVIIRNEANGQSVVGALFRRERESPGPKLQISSDAAQSLGILAGDPTALNVTALRREDVADTSAAADLGAVEAAPGVTEAPLEPIISAEAAIDAVPPAPAAAPTPAPTLEPAPAPPVSTLSRPFVQIGIFSVEANAERTAQQMRDAGLFPTIKRGDNNGAPFWRVVVGPIPERPERDSLLATIKGEGFPDAYAVTD